MIHVAGEQWEMSMAKDRASRTERPGPRRRAGLSRRRFLGAAALTIGAAGAVLLGSQPAEAKRSKAEAGYQDQPRGGQRCADCRFYVARNQTCQLVEGQVSPNGWCRFFAGAGGSYGY
jgi:hypothetical protein